MRSNWRVSENAGEAAAGYIRELLGEAAKSGMATMALSGGSAPVPMFRHLAEARFDWSSVHVFWADERPVPPNQEQSNFRLARELFLKPAGVPDANVHRIRAELPPEEAAANYADEIRRFFALGSTEMPRFDVIHLGMGADAHTASLFPGEKAIHDRTGIAAALAVEKLGQKRITLLPGVLLAARHIVMLVTGNDKADALRAVFHDPYDPERLPAQLIAHEAPHSQWFFDPAAARLLLPSS